MKKKVLYVYRTRRKQILDDWQKGKGPDNMLFGLNHLRQMDYQVDFFDYSYYLLNPLHWLFYPLEHAVIRQVGMGFKLDQAISLLPKIHYYDVIVCTGDSAGLPFLWLKHLGLIKKPIVYLSAGLTGALRVNPNSWVINFYKKILKAADVITCYARVEREFFINKMNIDKDKVVCIAYGTDWWFFSKKSNKKRSIIASVGIDSGRDYGTLIEAVKDLDVKVEIACHPSNVKDLRIPTNVKVRILIDYIKVRSMFQRARVVVVPMKEKGRSAGQMVVLEAMSARVPVIASSVRGITEAFDLIRERKHLLYTPPKDSLALKKKIIRVLNKPRLATSMGNGGSMLVKNNYTSKHLAENVAKFIQDLT